MADDKIATMDPLAGLEPAPEWLKVADGRRGLEGIGKDDLLIPRLALAQPLSPQCIDGDPRRIPNLNPGDLFNSLTGKIYGGKTTPVFLYIIRKDKLRAMEFRPMDEGGGIVDRDVPLDDKRLEWPADGKKPKATLFRDYLALLLPDLELIGLSFKGSGIKVAKELNGKIALRQKDIFVGRYAFTSAQALLPKPHQIYKVANAGWIEQAHYEFAEKMYNGVKDLDLTERIDRGSNDDPDAFDPAELERERKHRPGEADM